MIVARIFGVENIVGVDFCGVSFSLSSSQYFRKKTKLPGRYLYWCFFVVKLHPYRKGFLQNSLMCNILLLKNISGKTRVNVGKQGNIVFIPQIVVANSNRIFKTFIFQRLVQN